MTIQLHCFGESGNAYKAALALELAGLDWEPVFVDFFSGASHTDAFRNELNEMGEVPVMVDGDVHLAQSGVIQTYVTDLTGKFGGDTTADSREVLRWVFWDNYRMSGLAGMLRFMTNFLNREKRSDAVIDFLWGRLQGSLNILEGHLKGRNWIVGDAPTHADLSCCGYLFYPEPFGFVRTDWPNIDRWLYNVASLDGWQHPYDLMPPARAENRKG